MINKKLNYFDINFVNVTIPKKGNQLFDTDGSYEEEMYLLSIANENITFINLTDRDMCWDHLKSMSYDEFFFQKKLKKN